MTAHADRAARIWDARSGAHVRTLRTGRDVTAVGFDAGGAQVVTGESDGRVRRWDAATGAARGTFAHGTGPLTAVGFGPRGDLLLTSETEGRALVWDGAPNELLALAAREGAIAAFDPTGRRVLSVGPGGVVALSDCDACGPIGAVRRLARSLVGRRLTEAERAAYLHE